MVQYIKVIYVNIRPHIKHHVRREGGKGGGQALISISNISVSRHLPNNITIALFNSNVISLQTQPFSHHTVW